MKPKTTSAALRGVLALVSEAVERYAMLQPSDHVLVAFSGGPDSTALALALRELGYEVTLGHVDHQLRPTSRAERLAAQRSAERLGLPWLEKVVEVHPPTEQVARDERYRALSEMAEEAGASKIATGHTLDDDAETVLMRLVRGGKPIGIPPVRGNIVRPLIRVRRGDVLRALGAEGVSYSIDPSNSEMRYLRNMIRSRILPRFDDQTVVDLVTLGERAHKTRSRSNEEVADLLSRALVVSDDEGRLDDMALSGSFPAQVLRSAIAEVAGVEVTSRFVEDALRNVVGRTGSRLAINAAWEIVAEPDALVITQNRERAFPSQRPLKFPGDTDLPEWGIVIKARFEDEPVETGKHVARLDADKLGPLSVRSRRPGDRFQPLGMTGTKKLQDFLVDEKVPARRRDLVPLIVSGDDIVWVVGHRINERYRVTEETVRVLVLLRGSL